MRSKRQDGFSLIEALVAMTVLAVTATAILGAAETHTRTIAAVSDRTLAHWVAQNTLVELTFSGDVASTQDMGGRQWLVRLDRSTTADPDLGRIDVAIAPTTAPDTILTSLTGFVDIGGAREK